MSDLIDLQRHIEALPFAEDPLEAVLPDLRRLFRAERPVAFGLAPAGDKGRLQVDFFHSVGLPSGAPQAVRKALDKAYALTPRGQVVFDARRPEPRQRNTFLDLDEIWRMVGLNALPPQLAPLFRSAGARAEQQLRTLLCDRQILLAFVVLFRPEPFSPAERRQMDRLFTTVRRRVVLARQIMPRDLLTSSLSALMETIGAPAFITGPSGQVLHANAAGRDRLALARRDVGVLLADVARGHSPDGAACTPISSTGLGGHQLVILRDRQRELDERAGRAAARWRLTPRQSEVLGLVTRGLANKSIAQLLGCVEHTVALHVSAIFDRAGVDSRAALVAIVAMH